jgi:molybdopterin molybdotransferase
VPAGARLDAAAIGALATVGISRVGVHRRPRVRVLATGDELVRIGTVPRGAQIRNSNSPHLRALCLGLGAEVEDLGIVPDDERALESGVAAARGGAGLGCLSGGVSRGERDLVPDAFLRNRVERLFHRWRVQPGGPLWLGARAGVLVAGLPGNPAAVAVAFEVLLVPVLRALGGQDFAPRETLSARYEGGWGAPLPRRRYRPVALATGADGRLLARPAPWRGSGDPFALVGAHGLAAIPEGTEAPPEGAIVPVVPLARA